MIIANDPELESWIPVDEKSDFPIQNLPFGIFSTKNTEPRPATRIGDTVIDLSILADFGFFDGLKIKDLQCFYAPVLNPIIKLGPAFWSALRKKLSLLFNIENEELQGLEEVKKLTLFDVNDVVMHMPVEVGDYTDFYSSVEHATNVGKMFRDPDNALLPNWKHLPVGYHGRSSSIVVSGAEIHRPKGQTKPDEANSPDFGPTKQLDFELEMAFITGKKTKLGDSISVDEAENSIFGMVLFNDLSARDIQKWEYVPLGPFLSKSFGSVISPWVVTLEALQPFKVDGPEQDPPVLPYLKQKSSGNYDISLEVNIVPEKGEETKICTSNFKHLYWSIAQQLAHQTVGGCNINVGDMYASGTISGSESGTYGSMLELTWRGTKPLKLNDGSKRKFILDNDTVVMRGYAEKDGVRVGFGESSVKILPSK
jgi:fumarylacetoacetase